MMASLPEWLTEGHRASVIGSRAEPSVMVDLGIQPAADVAPLLPEPGQLAG
jgi:hypothetical protein